ncbi:MAG: FecR domain-containing protein [Anaerolineales bacterium]
MKKREDTLQKYLDMLEAGAPLERVLEQLSPDEDQLRHSLTLVAALRSLPSPPVDPKAAQKQNQIIHQYIQSRVRPKAQRIMTQPYQKRVRLVRSMAIIGIGLFLLVMTVWVAFTIPGWNVPEQGLTVIQLNGRVEVSRAEDPQRWQVVKAGDTFLPGQRLRTGSHSTIVLRFPDQSEISLAHDTEVSLSALSTTRDGSLSVEWVQQAGSTRHVVSPRQEANGNYVVRTPTSNMYVQGTTFSVAVANNGSAFIAVDEGSVSVEAGSEELVLTAGFATYTHAGEKPTSAAYSFSNHGELRRVIGNIWEVDEVLVRVSEETILDQELQAGDYVLVTGRILSNGRWVADTIEVVENIEHYVTFAGVLSAITRELWLVDDVSVLVTDATERSAGLVQGDLVRVTFTNLRSGRRLALRIDRLSPARLLPDLQSQMATEASPARSRLSFEPDDLEVSACSNQFNLTGFMENDGDSPQDLVKNIELAYAILTGSQFVESVTINPSSWTEILAGERVYFNVQVILSRVWLAALPEREVKLQLFVASEMNRPDPRFSRMRVTLAQACAQVETTPEAGPVSPTAPATPLPPTLQTTPSPAPVAGCPGITPHPEAQRLAALYKVSYNEIIAWFCDGIGFGEIDLAYSLSQQAGVPVADIFAMRRSGLGWGDIMLRLGLLPEDEATPEPTVEETEEVEDEEDAPPPWVTADGLSITPPAPPTLPIPPVP